MVPRWLVVAGGDLGTLPALSHWVSQTLLQKVEKLSPRELKPLLQAHSSSGIAYTLGRFAEGEP